MKHEYIKATKSQIVLRVAFLVFIIAWTIYEVM